MERSTSIPGIGTQLRQKREEQQLTVDDVASQLRLRKRLIEDIEDDNYHQLPVIYFKYHLRSYAKLLAFPDWEKLSLLDQPVENSLHSWGIFCPKKQLSARDKPVQWVTYSIISILILLVTLWWKSDNLLYKEVSANEQIPGQCYRVAQNTIIADETRGN